MPLSPIGRVSFHSVFQPTAMEKDQEKKYGVTLIFPKKGMKPDQIALLKAMKDSAEALCQEKFGCTLKDKHKGKAIRSPFRDGAEKDHLDGYNDEVIFVRFSGRNRPHVIGPDKSPITDDFYNGCLARVSYTTYSYTKGSPGIAFGLVNIQKTGDADPFGFGSSNPDNDFDAVDDDLSGDGGSIDDVL